MKEFRDWVGKALVETDGDIDKVRYIIPEGAVIPPVIRRYVNKLGFDPAEGFFVRVAHAQ